MFISMVNQSWRCYIYLIVRIYFNRKNMKNCSINVSLLETVCQQWHVNSCTLMCFMKALLNVHYCSCSLLFMFTIVHVHYCSYWCLKTVVWIIYGLPSNMFVLSFFVKLAVWVVTKTWIITPSYDVLYCDFTIPSSMKTMLIKIVVSTLSQTLWKKKSRLSATSCTEYIRTCIIVHFFT